MGEFIPQYSTNHSAETHKICVRATVDDDSFNAGGTITVNGWTVTVPKNMLVTFPNAFVSWPDFVAEQDAFKGFEMNIAGNIVNGSGESMAAQIYIAQYGLEFNQGYITAVNNDGTLQIQNGPLVKVNDPNGVFGAPSSDIPFMVADDESPSVVSTDSLCYVHILAHVLSRILKIAPGIFALFLTIQERVAQPRGQTS